MLSFYCSIGASNDRLKIFGQNNDPSNAHAVHVALIPLHIFKGEASVRHENSMNVSLSIMIGNCMSWKNDTQLWTREECSVRNL